MPPARPVTMGTALERQASRPQALALFAGLALAACSGQGVTFTTTGTGGGSSGTSSSTAGTGGADPTQGLFPDLATLQATGIAPTCALNNGVCHSHRDYPELGAAADLAAAVGAPCQLGLQDPSTTLPQCEVPGDLLALGGKDYEILRVTVAPGAPFPPDKVDLQLAAAPGSLDPSTARIHRPGAMGDAVSRPLAGVTLAAGSSATHVVVGLAGAMDPGLAAFVDVRAWHGDRVRMGDPNGDGMAHASPSPWSEITPGDPSRSLFYQRLVVDQYGPLMPLLPRTWSPAATRAVWCWIRGLPKGAQPSTIDPHAPIHYAGCPADPNAPDPNAPGGWPAVKLLVESKCATGPCHSATTRSAMLDLTPAAFTKDVIDVASSQQPGALRVVPGQPAASYLLCKVDPACGSRAPKTGTMPLNATPLSKDEIKTIADWIQSGAPTQ